MITTISDSFERIALFGGLYSNYLAIQAAIDDAHRRGAEALFCLGDLGGFGPHPDRVFPILEKHQVTCLQGNYDDSIGNELDDCQCGYTDPRDNYFAQLSYDYTLRHTSPQNRAYLRRLPQHIRCQVGTSLVLMCHGSPRRVNEFLWESTSSTHFLQYLCEQQSPADILAVTHTGMKWHRPLGGRKHFLNVGVLGRPENDGHTNVWYSLLTASPLEGVEIEFIPVQYDHLQLAREMRQQRLPPEFIETITSGWWTTCLEVLPSKERKRGRY